MRCVHVWSTPTGVVKVSTPALAGGNLSPGFEYEHSDWEFVFRTGIGYEFEIAEIWALTPQLNIDFVDGEEKFVYGISVGKVF